MVLIKDFVSLPRLGICDGDESFTQLKRNADFGRRTIGAREPSPTSPYTSRATPFGFFFVPPFCDLPPSRLLAVAEAALMPRGAEYRPDSFAEAHPIALAARKKNLAKTFAIYKLFGLARRTKLGECLRLGPLQRAGGSGWAWCLAQARGFECILQ